MTCVRCEKQKPDNGIALCVHCGHRKSGAMLYRLQKVKAGESARERSSRQRQARRGMSRLLDQFFGR